MSTDRELLEKAAKAAGYNFQWESAFLKELPEPTVFTPEGFGQYWNPLEDDGDALRLAVKLHFTCRFYMGDTISQSTVPGGPSVYITDRCHRRAITRAAAALADQEKA